MLRGVQCIQIVMMSIYPVFIAPLFNKFNPLEVSSVRESARMVAARISTRFGPTGGTAQDKD